jgi:hypothetical protein
MNHLITAIKTGEEEVNDMEKLSTTIVKTIRYSSLSDLTNSF